MNREARRVLAPRRFRLVAAGGIVGLELVLLAAGYQIVGTLDCDATSTAVLCTFLGSLIARGTAVLAVLGLVLWARPAETRTLMERIETRPFHLPWFLLHLAGVALIFSPLATAGYGREIDFAAALAPWLAGGVAAAVGGLLLLAPVSAWLEWARSLGWPPLASLAAGFLLPDLAKMAQPLWDLSGPSRVTFESVYILLDLAGAEPQVSFADRTIGLNSFQVEIARACSGIEGVVLLIGFAALYSVLFRSQLRLARFWFTAVPLGVLASLALNVVRIAGLLAIGAHVSPDFALNGFHSYAGWMLFTLLALALLCCAHSIGWLQPDGRFQAAVPLRSDRNAAYILPFLVLMAADVAIAATFHEPGLAYPLRLLAGAAVIGVFWHAYKPILHGPIDPAAVGFGVALGLVWLLARFDTPPAEAAAAVTNLGGIAFVAWAAARVAGTVLLVPLVEELFFRGYVLARLDGPEPVRRALAVVISSALFGAMHERWLIGFLTGVVFALIYLRRGRLRDAIAAHVSANLVVAVWALAADDWTAI